MVPENASLVAPKAVLYCPDCDHRSGVDGDWLLVEDGEDVQYTCPECTSVITTRPRPAVAASP